MLLRVLSDEARTFKAAGSTCNKNLLCGSVTNSLCVASCVCGLGQHYISLWQWVGMVCFPLLHMSSFVRLLT